MNKATNITQKISAVILALVSLWISVVSLLNFSFVAQWQGSASELAQNNVSLMTVFSVGCWPLTILLGMSYATTAFFLFKKKPRAVVFNVALVCTFIISAIFIHILSVSTGFELHPIKGLKSITNRSIGTAKPLRDLCGPFSQPSIG